MFNYQTLRGSSATMDVLSATLMLLAVAILTPIAKPLVTYFVLVYKLRNVPGPKGLPFFGHIFEFTDNSEYFKKIYQWSNEFREHGYYIFYFGMKPSLVIINPDDMEKVMLNTNLNTKGFGYDPLKSWLGDGLLVSKGPKWAKRRKLLTPSFHFTILSKFLDVFNEQAQHFTENLSKMVDMRSVNIAPLVTLCTLDVICETIMGHKLESQGGKNKEYVSALHRFGLLQLKRLNSPWVQNDFIYSLTRDGKDEARCVNILHELTRKVIRERKLYRVDDNVVIDDESQDVRGRRRLAFLDLLIEVQKRDDSLTDEGIQEEVDTFMFEGHDTVATSVTFALYLIGRHPQVQEKIHEELDSIFGCDHGRPVTQDDLAKMEYLGCVMKESQRLLTTVCYTGREVEEEFYACGMMVPPGVNLTINLFDLHRDPKYFPNPDVFDPNRFLPANSKDRHTFAHIPFSAGHRNCIGQKFAVMEQKVLLATVLRKLKVTSLQKMEDLRLTVELVLRPLDGIDIHLEIRD